MSKIINYRHIISNEMGLHGRPASFIARCLQAFQSKVTFSCDELTVDAKQVMDLLLLQAKKNTLISIKVEGEDAEEALKELIDTLENQMGDAKYGSYKK